MVNETAPLINLVNLDFRYEGGMDVLKGASMSLERRERVGLIGPIGSGKTTLLHLIVGLLNPCGGRVELFGSERRSEKDFREVRERAGLLFQDPEDQLFCPTVLEDTAFGPLNQGRTREETLVIVEETLRELGIEGFGERITHHLSGGEKRLVSLATILAMRPDILLLDEPVSGLDPQAADRIRSLLLDLPQAMIIVSHDREFLKLVTTRCVRIAGGVIEPLLEENFG